MSFGVSGSDVVLVVDYLWQAVRALRQDGGSQQDFRSLAKLRRTWEDLLKEVHSALPHLGLDAPLIATTNQQIEDLLSEFQRLERRVAKSERSLGLGAPEDWYRGIVRKIQWQLKAKDERQHLSDLLQQVNSFTCATNL